MVHRTWRSHDSTFVLSTVLSILGAAFWLALITTGCSPSDSQAVIQVGTVTIHRQDIEYRNQVIHVEYPSDTREKGSQQLVEAYVFAEILRSLGQPITTEAMEAERQRIDRHTRAPEKLLEIKRIFGLDQKSYLKDYVLPVLALRTLPYVFFPQHPEYQEKRHELARSLFETVKVNPKDLRSWANEPTIVFQKLTLNHRTLKFENRNRNRAPDVPIEPSLLSVFDLIRRNPKARIIPELFECQEGWIIFQPRSVHGDKFQLDSLLIRKVEFGEWLETQAPKIAVTYLPGK